MLCGSEMKIEIVRVRGPQSPFVVSVTVSVPDAFAVYLLVKEPDCVPEDGEIELRSADVRLHDATADTEHERLALAPR